MTTVGNWSSIPLDASAIPRGGELGCLPTHSASRWLRAAGVGKSLLSRQVRRTCHVQLRAVPSASEHPQAAGNWQLEGLRAHGLSPRAMTCDPCLTTYGPGLLRTFCHPLQIECKLRESGNFCLLCSRCILCLARCLVYCRISKNHC